MAAERPDGAWHYHARCCDCRQRLWWNARPGDATPLRAAINLDCAFIEPAAQKSTANVIISGDNSHATLSTASLRVRNLSAPALTTCRINGRGPSIRHPCAIIQTWGRWPGQISGGLLGFVQVLCYARLVKILTEVIAQWHLPTARSCAQSNSTATH